MRCIEKVKQQKKKISVEKISQMFGRTRQGYYKRLKYEERRRSEEQIIVESVKEARRRQPRSGGKKVYKKVSKKLREKEIKIGRDKFFEVLKKNDLLVKRRKRVYTTQSGHRFKKYPNLIKEINLQNSNRVYVSDITYIRTLEGFCYLSLITDKYSRKIVGNALSKSLSIEGCLEALRMALKGLDKTDADTSFRSRDTVL